MTLDWNIASLIDRGEVDQSWSPILRPVQSTIDLLALRLSELDYLPAATDVFRALRTPRERIRVLILGQDPYPTPGHAEGLAFSVPERIRPLPGSLRNIFRELRSDLDVIPPESGNLSAWVTQGVMLLNRTLSVQPGHPLAHRKFGWDIVTGAVLDAFARGQQPLVALLWGVAAREAGERYLNVPHVRRVESAHPSPLSASRGFLGSRPFSRANAALVELNLDPVDWSLPSPDFNPALLASDVQEI